jgi:hypothetical protein
MLYMIPIRTQELITSINYLFLPAEARTNKRYINYQPPQKKWLKTKKKDQPEAPEKPYARYWIEKGWLHRHFDEYKHYL